MHPDRSGDAADGNIIFMHYRSRRRRVGKTYLIRQTYDGILTFEHSGLANAGRKEQIQGTYSNMGTAT